MVGIMSDRLSSAIIRAGSKKLNRKGKIIHWIQTATENFELAESCNNNLLNISNVKKLLNSYLPLRSAGVFK